MKKVTLFQCEICQTMHEQEARALSCEKRGKEKPLVWKGQKVKYQDNRDKGYNSSWKELYVSDILEHGHHLEYVLSEEPKAPCYIIWGNTDFQQKCEVIEQKTVFYQCCQCEVVHKGTVDYVPTCIMCRTNARMFKKEKEQV